MRLRGAWAAGALALACGVSFGAEAMTWRELAPLPAALAGVYAGVSHGALLVAGGANFPDRPPWENGTKVWHDDVYVLQKPEGSWRAAGHLPRPGGYGLSLTLPEGVLLIGGGDRGENFREVWLATWDGKSVAFEAWPALPCPLAMACGAVIDRTVYVAGGTERPGLLPRPAIFLTLDLDHRERGWKELPPWPGPPVVLASAAAQSGDFLLAGGSGGAPRQFYRQSYRFHPGGGWSKLPDLPRGVAAAPSGCGARAEAFALGGDDGAHLGEPVALAQKSDFARDFLVFEPDTGQWRIAGPLPFSLAATPLVVWHDELVIPGGEPRPGWRSRKVWMTTR